MAVKKRVGILISGDDCTKLNAAMRGAYVILIPEMSYNIEKLVKSLKSTLLL